MYVLCFLIYRKFVKLYEAVPVEMFQQFSTTSIEYLLTQKSKYDIPKTSFKYFYHI